MATITFDPLLNRLEFSQSTAITGAVIYKGGYNAATNTPDLTTSPASIKAGAMYTVTAAGTLYGENLEAGDSIIAEIDNPTAVGNWTFLQKNTTGGSASQYLSAGAVATLLETTTNWDVNGNYTGASITGTLQGQSHYNGNYWFTAVADNTWIRLIRG
jgi:hypothetical protein